MEQLVVDRKLIGKNLDKIRRQCGVPLIGVLDGDGQGLGALALARLLLASGVQQLAASRAAVAREVLDVFPRADVLLLCPFLGEEELQCVLARSAAATIATLRDAAVLEQAAEVPGLPQTQMGRAASLLSRCSHLELDGAYTYLCEADLGSEKTLREQKARFDAMLGQLQADGVQTGLTHLAGTYAGLRYPFLAAGAVRVDCGLDGRLPRGDKWGLTPVGRLDVTVDRVLTLAPEEAGGKERRVAAVRMSGAAQVLLSHRLDGHAGLLRLLDRKPAAFWNGKRLPVHSRWGAELVLLEIGRQPVREGDVVSFPVRPSLVGREVERTYV